MVAEDKGKKRAAWSSTGESGGVLEMFHLIVQDFADFAGRVARLEDAVTSLRDEIKRLTQHLEGCSMEEDPLEEEE